VAGQSRPDINSLKYWKVTTYKPTSAQLVLQSPIRIENGIEKWRSIIGNIKKSVIV
jgi:hypothetical protein